MPKFYSACVWCWLLAAGLVSAFIIPAVIAEPSRDFTGDIALNEPTRISVVDDRIKSVKKVSGLFSIDANRVNGDIFLLPHESIKAGQVITFFLVTEKHKTYRLVLHTKDIPAQEIIIKNPLVARETAQQWETANPYEPTAIHLYHAIHGEEHLPGFDISFKKVPVKLWDGVKTTKTAHYRGYALTAERYQLVNEGLDTLRFEEREFYKPGVIAVVAQQRILKRGEEAMVYVISQPQ